MYYAPVLITTLNRTEHLKKLIDSLKMNPYAKYTDVFIGLDYPPDPRYEEGYKKTKEFLESGIDGFKSVKLYIHPYNIGAVENVRFLFEIVKSEYDRFILTEDDNVFSPCFLEYMDKGLEIIKEDHEMMWVCGYSYPVKWEVKDSNVLKEQSFVSAWGFGTYFKKLNEMDDFLSTGFIRDGYLKRLGFLRRYSKKNYVYALTQLYKTNSLVANDIGYSCYQLFQNKYCLMPKVSFVRNEGWDGSGINCSDNDLGFYSHQIISESSAFDFSREISTSKDIPHYYKNEQIINRFYPANKVRYLKCLLKELIIRIRRIRNDQ